MCGDEVETLALTLTTPNPLPIQSKYLNKNILTLSIFQIDRLITVLLPRTPGGIQNYMKLGGLLIQASVS